LALSTLHAHLDHDHCIESVLLKGPVQQVRRFANSVVAERGVRHGQLNLVMVDVAQEHTHADGSRHTHLKPQR
ncbi:MAG: nickel-responsive transcriptional regulator NikR, partial [Betaproteobacteria bacterium]